MDLKIIGSSSKGNCYIFDNGDEALAVECGIPFSRLRRAMDFKTRHIVGAVISHEHGDHSAAVGKFLDSFIPVYTSRGTAKALGIDQHNLVHQVADHEMVAIGKFRVMPFRVEHDAAEPFGFLIHHPAMGTTLFATDTRYLRYAPFGNDNIIRFPGVNNILIECNYRHDILGSNLAAGRLPKALANRTKKSHCSFAECRATILAQDLSGVNNIVLIHLSDSNANAAEFQADVEAATGKTITVATPGLIIKNFSKSPF